MDNPIEQDQNHSGVKMGKVDYEKAKTPMRIILAIFLWLLIGTVWYRMHVQWTWATSFFFAVESGISVGYTYPDEPFGDNVTYVFTILHVLIGSSLVHGTMAFFFFHLITPSSAVFSKKQYILAMKEAKKNQGELSSHSVMLRSMHWLNTRVVAGRYFVGAYSKEVRFRATIGYLLLVIIGIIFGIATQGWPFITSLYFAVTSLSGAALIGPPCLNGGGLYTCNINDGQAVFLAFYLFIGNPFHFFFVGQFASMVVDYIAIDIEIRKLRSFISKTEFKNALTTRQNTTNKLSRLDFIILQLIKLGQIDWELVDYVTEIFQKLDTKGNKCLHLDDLIEGRYFIDKDPNSANSYSPVASPSKNISYEDVGVEETNIDDEEDYLDKYVNSKKNDDKLESEISPLVKNILSFPLTFMMFVFATWWITGIIWYTSYLKWDFYTAFYYCIDAGLSIGYGDVTEPMDQLTQTFTIIYLLIGSVVVSGLCCFLVRYLLSPRKKQKERSNELQKKIKKKDLPFISYLKKTSYRWRVIVLLIVWFQIGVFYTMSHQGWDYITSLYFCVTGLSTAGNLGSPCVNHIDGIGCNIGASSSIFVAIYSFFGLPIYSCALSQVADAFISHFTNETKMKRLAAPITKDEFDFAFERNHASPRGSKSIQFGNFLLLQIMRLGYTSREQILRINKAFFELDNGDKDYITLDDVLAAGVNAKNFEMQEIKEDSKK